MDSFGVVCIERNDSVSAGRRCCAIAIPARRERALDDPGDPISAAIPICRAPAAAELQHAACSAGPRKRGRWGAYLLWARAPAYARPTAGFGSGVGKYGVRSGGRSGGHVRSARAGAACVEGSDVAGSAAPGSAHRAGSCLDSSIESDRRCGGAEGRMTTARLPAAGVLALVVSAAAWPGAITAVPYDRQFRDFPNAPMSRQFPLGTDELGRDRFSRLLYGTRLSLLAAPAAALVSAVLAAVAGGLAGFLGGSWDRAASVLVDLMLALPWLFLLIIVRAALPLNMPAAASIVVTFGLIGLLGWPSAARVVRAGCRELRQSDLVLQARACGLAPNRVL